jgi:hypothetical protein
VNEPYKYSETCDSYRKKSSLQENTNHTACWFVNVPGENGHASVGLSLKFKNGQTAPIAAKGDFIVRRPTVYLDLAAGPYVFPSSRSLAAEFTIKFTVKHFCCPGIFNGLQLINSQYSFDDCYAAQPYSHSTDGDFWLDGTPSLRGDQGFTVNYMAPDSNFTEIGFNDRPHIDGTFKSYANCNRRFNFFIQYTPTGANSIAVTIASLTWNWDASLYYSNGTGCNGGSLHGNLPHSDYQPSLTNDAFPEWEKVYYGN